MNRVKLLGALFVICQVPTTALLATHRHAPTTGSRPVPRVHLYLFVKDQAELLGDWIRFHTHVFSAANLHIVDHQTTDGVARRFLDEASASGAHVVPHEGDFKDKHKVLSKLMRSTGGDAEFLVPLDVDEFVGVWRPSNRSYTFQKADIMDEFARLPRDGRKYKFGWVNPHICRHDDPASRRPAVYATKFPKRSAMMISPTAGNPSGCVSKTFFPADSFIATDQGNHEGRVQRDLTIPCKPRDCSSCYHTEETHGLTLVHLGARHAMTYQNYRGKMIRGALSYNHDATARERDCKPLGHHYCKFWVQLKALGDVGMRNAFHAAEDRSVCAGPDTFALSHMLQDIASATEVQNASPTAASLAATPPCVDAKSTWLSAQGDPLYADEPVCVFNERPRAHETIVTLLLDAETARVPHLWLATAGDAPYDVLLLDATGATTEQLRPALAHGYQVARLHLQTDRAHIWNVAFAIARRGGYSHVIMGSSLATPSDQTIPTMLTALQGGTCFVVPTTNRRGAGLSSQQWWATVAGATEDRLAVLEHDIEHSSTIQDALIAHNQARLAHDRNAGTVRKPRRAGPLRGRRDHK